MRDLRSYARQTNIRLVGWFFALVIFVGLGLIYVFYGLQGAITGLICLVATTIPIGLVALTLWGLDRFLVHANKNLDEDATDND